MRRREDNSTVTLAYRNRQSIPYARVRILRTRVKRSGNGSHRRRVVYREGQEGTAYVAMFGCNVAFTFSPDIPTPKDKRERLSREDFEIINLIGGFVNEL